MSRHRTALAVIGLASAFSAAFASIAIAQPQPRFIWNASPSAPIGLYYVERTQDVARGDLVATAVPPSLAGFMAERRYVPHGIPLIKHVAAFPGERVCRWGPIVTINGKPVAVARSRDRLDRPLPTWSGCITIAWDELFLLNTQPDSLDGRYFGPLPKAGLIGRAHPLLTRAAPGSALRWRASIFHH